MSKKSRRRNKKILAALALAGGAAMLGRRGKGAVTGVPLNPNLQKNIAADAGADIAAEVAAPVLRKPPIGRMHGAGTDAEAIAAQDKRANQSKIVRGILPPSQLLTPQRTHVGRGVFKGGGIAKRGTGVALKKGGRVTGIAKRGFGRALMKGKK